MDLGPDPDDRAGGRLGVSVEAEQPEDLNGSSPGMARRRAYAEGCNLDVLPHAQLPEGVRVLKGTGEAAAPTAVGAPGRDRLAVELDTDEYLTELKKEGLI